jgi:uncharacterized protein
MIVCVLRVELLVPSAHSLKEKRAVIRPMIDGARHRFSVSAAETAFQDKWQRAEIGVALVGGTEAHVRDVVEAVERFLWSFPEVEISAMERSWFDPDD